MNSEKVFVVWQKDSKNVAVMDISKMVEDTIKEQPELQRVIIINAIIDLAEADFVITAESEEQMLEMFPNAEVRYERDNNKEVH